jgi:sialic acid synthase SpsE
MILIAELSTNHGGDVALACDMVRAAAEAGCDYAKIQSYSLGALNPRDPQADWLRQAHLDREDTARVLAACQEAGIQFLSTPFDAASLTMLRELGQTTFKIASSESGNRWWLPAYGETWFVSWPWGRGGPCMPPTNGARLTAIPLYPTPPECVGQAQLLEGWSDHTVGLAACQWAIARGVQVLEAHLCLPGRGRECEWDKSRADFKELRAFANDVATMTTGVATRFRERWTAGA